MDSITVISNIKKKNHKQQPTKIRMRRIIKREI